VIGREMPKAGADQDEARETILALLDERDPGKTICPSEAARAMDEENFRGLMQTVRGAASELVDEGVIDVTQGGLAVDLATVRGPIRLRLRDG